MHIFYTPEISDGMVTLSAEESAHCARVLRLKPGQTVAITTGAGTMVEANLVDVSPKATTAAIITRHDIPQRAFRIHLAVAPTKNIDRFEWFLEKATEVGVQEITPIICSHSERTVVKPERLEKILLSAMKQSMRAWLPVLHPAVKFSDFVKEKVTDSGSYIAWCGDGEKKLLSGSYVAGSDALIMIGPEGDFSTEEVELAIKIGARPVSLGESRLRTETAALTACMLINFLNGEI